MLGQAIEAIGRIEGMGGSLRSLHVNRGNVSGDFIGYMRLQGQDLTLIRSLLSLAGVRPSPVTLPQVQGKLESAAVPDNLPASFYLLTDPGTVRAGDRDIEVGWAMVADSNDRLTWMLGLERSAAVVPAFYFELPDLWQLIAATGEGPRELNFAQSWLTGRSVRVAADIIQGRLRIDMQLAKAAAPPAHWVYVTRKCPPSPAGGAARAPAVFSWRMNTARAVRARTHSRASQLARRGAGAAVTQGAQSLCDMHPDLVLGAPINQAL